MARIKGHFISRLPSTHFIKIYLKSFRFIPFAHIFCDFPPWLVPQDALSRLVSFVLAHNIVHIRYVEIIAKFYHRCVTGNYRLHHKQNANCPKCIDL